MATDMLSAMEIADARLAVDQILNEERQRPTVCYEDVADEWIKHHKEMTPEEIASWTKITSTPRRNLWALRQESPRSVTETPDIFRFSSTNFDLLMSVYGRVHEKDRPQLIDYVLQRLRVGGTGTHRQPQNYGFPSYDWEVCELPLVLEFCIRTRNIEPLFAATAKPKMPTPALAIMLIQLEDTIALNWDWFSDDQLQELPTQLASLQEIADRQTYSARGDRDGPMVRNPRYVRGHEREAKQIVKSIYGIAKECEQARYWYLKGALQRTVNLEVQSDKAKVESFLTELGFSKDMIKALNAAENDYRSTTSPFELKSCLGHIRSFLEHLHREAAKSAAATAGDSVVDRWGDATSYLRQQGCLTSQQEAFVTALYTLISDTSVHPLGTDREYARLLRNVVIEYGVMFLTMLAKKGVKVG